MPISRSRTAADARLEPRPLPSTGITRLRRYYGPIRHPRRPGLSLAGVRLAGPRLPPLGLPVLRCGFRLRTCRRHYPGRTGGALGPLIVASVDGGLPLMTNGSAPALRVSRFTQRSLTLRPARSPGRQATLCPGGFRRFVTLPTAPGATGWSDPVPGRDLHPLKTNAFARRTVISRLPPETTPAVRDIPKLPGRRAEGLHLGFVRSVPTGNV